jgi:hypothetical protein
VQFWRNGVTGMTVAPAFVLVWLSVRFSGVMREQIPIL